MMMIRGHVRKDLYDFVSGTLPPDDRASVERHLRRCRRCSAEMKAIVRTLASLSRPAERPSDSLPSEFWSGLADSIERRTTSADRHRHRPAIFTDSLLVLASSRRLILASVGAAAVLLVAAGILLRDAPDVPSGSTTITTAHELVVPDSSIEALSDYFRRSKAVLVGLENKQPADAADHVDLSAEKNASRLLVEEGRAIRSRPVDAHSTALVADLERIMIEVANSRDQVAPDDIQMIRDGIRKQNLLFKTRMAEQTYANPRFVRASGTYPPR